ncbi:flagellar assembly protein FliW [Pimelobacter simplex]|uniref:flagellar assembly protein FliW n=2 Tax=Pimelobacter TaxID=2044 RepID=UPI001C056DD6|nr:flagellar assembly protein FliW [Pimelobacter simplex]MBU2694748.1 flagellar assembly protein FliW [Pimelobacter sp. 30-1]UUW91965.1 flagellar assembly protein FliW [Pimelobacter simplex]UUW95792.1 flagellar assembly protein FliW [Pimelobacter simplex]
MIATMDIPVIELAHPMPGFPADERFALVRLDDTGVLHGFRSLDSDDLQFVVVPPAPFFPDYAPEIADEVADELGISSDSADEVLVLLVVRAGATLADTTVNLRAPLVVNPATRRASQVILDDAELPLAAPLVA